MTKRLQAAVFDWAGTLVDHGSRAPMGVFLRSFAEFGVEISIEEARGFMGMAKKDHIRSVLELPRVAGEWQRLRGAAPTEADVESVYDIFVPMNVAVVTDHADVIPGAPETFAALRARGLKIGSTTGYTREIMAPLLPIAKAAGVAPQSLVCAGDLSQGRPSPMMMYQTFLELEVWPASTAVKVDDTPVGIEEGLSAGSWTVGVALSGNACGLSVEELAALSAADLASQRARACSQLTAAGAHFVIDSVADLLPVIDRIDGALARGERP
ncbi:MAG: phosphonoacetaldehyde hydrolase [Pseudomonadota bacterium]